MSRLALPSGDDHPEAAGRHLTDASILQQDDRCDGAAYLAGYVIECTLKTIIVFRTAAGQPRGHDLDGLSLAAASTKQQRSIGIRSSPCDSTEPCDAAPGRGLAEGR